MDNPANYVGPTNYELYASIDNFNFNLKFLN